MDIPV
jgi:hypothetical protein